MSCTWRKQSRILVFVPKIQEFSIKVCDAVMNAALLTTRFHV